MYPSHKSVKQRILFNVSRICKVVYVIEQMTHRKLVIFL